MNRKLAIASAAVVLVASGIGAGYWFAMHRMTAQASAQAAAAPASKKPLYWHDPMYPQQKFDAPGKSPYMDMMLVPVYADAGGEDSAVKIDPRVVQNLGVRTAEVKRGVLERKIEAVGTIAFDERSVTLVQARVNGFVERLFARAPLDPVTKGQPLAEILAPDWIAAQEEFLAMRASPHAGEALRQAARQRLVLLGMPEETIAAVEAEGRTRARITITSPATGVIAELGAREGMAVAPGAMLFRINGLATVWINADVPETQASWVKPGAKIEATVPAYPGERFSGRVAAILPEVSPATRTLKARIELANPQGRLKPGMYATVDFASQERREALLVPSEALIRTGQRNVVIAADAAADGKLRFRPVDVEVGDESGGLVEIASGLAEGTKVVVSGQFLIDSEASLRSTVARMSDAPAQDIHHGEGRVEKIGKGELTLSHGPIASMQWGAMTMEFVAPKSGVPPDVKEGSRVTFEFRPAPDGRFEITSIRTVAGAPK